MGYFAGAMKRRIPQQKFDYVETPAGIFTTAGHWFHTTGKQIDEYAPGLTRRYPLGELLRFAEQWVVSPDSVSLVIFLILSLFMNCIIAEIISLIFFLFWYFNKSAFISVAGTTIIRFLNIEVVLVVLGVLMISVKGINGDYLQVILGFLFFFLYKFGWLRRLLDRQWKDRSKGIPLNDRIIRMLVIKYSLHEGIDVKEKNIIRWEKDIRDLLQKRRKQK